MGEDKQWPLNSNRAQRIVSDQAKERNGKSSRDGLGQMSNGELVNVGDVHVQREMPMLLPAAAPDLVWQSSAAANSDTTITSSPRTKVSRHRHTKL